MQWTVQQWCTDKESSDGNGLAVADEERRRILIEGSYNYIQSLVTRKWEWEKLRKEKRTSGVRDTGRIIRRPGDSISCYTDMAYAVYDTQTEVDLYECEGRTPAHWSSPLSLRFNDSVARGSLRTVKFRGNHDCELWKMFQTIQTTLLQPRW